MRTYADPVRRMSRRATAWIYSQPVWRYLLIHFTVQLTAIYVIWSGLDWVVAHTLHWSGPYRLPSMLYLATYASGLTMASLLGRRNWRRRLRLTRAPEQP